MKQIKEQNEVDHYQSRSCIMISDEQLGKIWIGIGSIETKRIEVYNKEKKESGKLINPINDNR